MGHSTPGRDGPTLFFRVARFVRLFTAFFLPEDAFIDRFRYLVAQTFTREVVRAEVLSGKNTAQACFLGCRGEAVEVTSDACQRFGSDVKGKAVAKVERQHGRAGFADCAVRSGVRKVWRGLRAQRQPGWIAIGLRISIRIRH